MNSEKIIRDHIWFPFTCSDDIFRYPPLQIEKGAGIYVYDRHGRAYLDAVGSWWVNVLGHNHPVISAAVAGQLDKLEHVLMAGFVAAPTVQLTERLLRALPAGLSRIFYSDDGSTAVEAALKMALQYWDLKGQARSRFVALSGGYHGDTLGAMCVGGMPGYHGLFTKNLPPNYLAHAPYCYRCPCGQNKELCRAECMDSLRDILDTHASEIAACIFEPMVQGAAGMRIYPAKVLSRIFELCREYGILTIADEVATGFGRTGTMFACQHADAVPDIMCMAKGLTGGYLPMAATAVTDAIYDTFRGDATAGRTFNHGHSFTGNALAASAACATLTLFEQLDIPHSLQGKMEYFADKLRAFAALDIVGDVRSIGLVGAIEIVRDKRTKALFPSEKRIPFLISQNALKHGLIIRPLDNVLYCIPAYIITLRQIDEMLDALKTAICETSYA